MKKLIFFNTTIIEHEVMDIYQSNTTVAAFYNKVVGNENTIYGNNNKIHGNGCKIIGNNNDIYGKSNYIYGTSNLAFGDDNILIIPPGQKDVFMSHNVPNVARTKNY
jgi:hypothetical protein